MPSPFDSVNFGEVLGECSVDGLLMPCSMVDRMFEAVQFVRTEWRNGRFHQDVLPDSRDLPGRMIWSFSPDRWSGTGGSVRTTTVDGIPLNESAETWFDLDIVSHGQMLYFGNWNSQVDPAGRCYTYYQMIYENPNVQKYMNELWEQTVASTKRVYEASGTNSTAGAPEFAGIVTIDVENYKHSFYNLGGIKPEKGGFNISGPIKRALEQDKADGRNGRVLLEIHTHVPEPLIIEMMGPFVNENDPHRWVTSWNPDLVMAPPSGRYASMQDNLRGGGFEGQGGSWVGIAVWGKGKFDLYGAETDKEKLKKMCVPGQRLTLSRSL